MSTRRKRGRRRHVIAGIVGGLAPQQERGDARVGRRRGGHDGGEISRGLRVLAQLEVRLRQTIRGVPARRARRLHALRELVLRARFVAIAGEPVALALQQEHVRADRGRERGAQEILRERRDLRRLLRVDHGRASTGSGAERRAASDALRDRAASLRGVGIGRKQRQREAGLDPGTLRTIALGDVRYARNAATLSG